MPPTPAPGPTPGQQRRRATEGRVPPGGVTGRVWAAPVLPLRPGIPESAATITSGMGHYVVRCAEGRDVGGRPGDRCLLSHHRHEEFRTVRTVLISLVHGSAAATHRADQAGRAELNTSRYSAEAPITPCTASAAAASPTLAAFRLAGPATPSR